MTHRRRADEQHKLGVLGVNLGGRGFLLRARSTGTGRGRTISASGRQRRVQRNQTTGEMQRGVHTYPDSARSECAQRALHGHVLHATVALGADLRNCHPADGSGARSECLGCEQALTEDLKASYLNISRRLGRASNPGERDNAGPEQPPSKRAARSVRERTRQLGAGACGWTRCRKILLGQRFGRRAAASGDRLHAVFCPSSGCTCGPPFGNQRCAYSTQSNYAPTASQR